MNTKKAPSELDALYRVVHGIEANGARWEAGTVVALRDLPAQARAHLIRHGHIVPQPAGSQEESADAARE